MSFPAGARHSSFIAHGASLKHFSPSDTKSGQASLHAATGSSIGETVVASGASVVSISGATVVVILTSGFDAVVAAGLAVVGLVGSAVVGAAVVPVKLVCVVAGRVVANGTAVVGAAVVSIEHDVVHGLHNGTPQSNSFEIESHQSGHNEDGFVVPEGDAVVASFGAAVVVANGRGVVATASFGAAVLRSGDGIVVPEGDAVVASFGAAVVVAESTCSGRSVVASASSGAAVLKSTDGGEAVVREQDSSHAMHSATLQTNVFGTFSHQPAHGAAVGTTTGAMVLVGAVVTRGALVVAAGDRTALVPSGPEVVVGVFVGVAPQRLKRSMSTHARWSSQSPLWPSRYATSGAQALAWSCSMQHMTSPAGARHSSVISHGLWAKHAPYSTKPGHFALHSAIKSVVGAAVVARDSGSAVVLCTCGTAAVVAAGALVVAQDKSQDWHSATWQISVFGML